VAVKRTAGASRKFRDLNIYQFSLKDFKFANLADLEFQKPKILELEYLSVFVEGFSWENT
jgi:hypothetical protein